MSATIRKTLGGAATVLLALLFISTLQPAQASARQRCFRETGFCVGGRFLEYWDQNGGLPVFGYPISGTDAESGEQWFERAVFERHQDTPAPYDVQLSRLGDWRFLQQSLAWQDLPPDEGPRAGCLWFAETQRNICDQQPGRGFLTYWKTHGLHDPRLDAYGNSLALFGLPLTGARPETNEAGEKVITQWFERARFEWHPDKPDQYKVLLGLLGREVWDNRSGDSAELALKAFFGALNDGRYSAASQLYGGSYDVLREYNPALKPSDHFNLLKAACEANGFQCLRVKRVVSNDYNGSEYHIVVEFANADGSRFVRGNDRQSQFAYTVRGGADGRFRVLELPPYVA
jgi:hypothetical protein